MFSNGMCRDPSSSAAQLYVDINTTVIGTHVWIHMCFWPVAATIIPMGGSTKTARWLGGTLGTFSIPADPACDSFPLSLGSPDCAGVPGGACSGGCGLAGSCVTDAFADKVSTTWAVVGANRIEAGLGAP